MTESRSPAVPPGFDPPKRPRPPEVVFALVPAAGVEPNKFPLVVPAVVDAVGFVVFVPLLRFPNNPPPVVPVLFPKRLPLGAAVLDVPVLVVFNPRAFNVPGAAAVSGGLFKFHVVAAAAGVMVDPVRASRTNYYR